MSSVVPFFCMNCAKPAVEGGSLSWTESVAAEALIFESRVTGIVIAPLRAVAAHVNWAAAGPDPAIVNVTIAVGS
jgi:hypothetical protein